jgi:hypothetical protein
MKAKIYFLLVFISFLLIESIYPQAKINKHCLIVAIGEYKYMRHISAINDIPLIKSALEMQGFTDFRILKNEQATRNNILKELKKLEDDTQPDDIVVIHFSSHGQGIPDDHGDEADGIDESICCYGAQEYLTDTYRGEEHLSDDVLGEKLDKIRVKAGSNGQVLVLLDACYSGSGTRGDDRKSRGIENLLTKKGDIQNRSIKDDLAFSGNDSKTGDGKIAPLIVFSGSRADEKNYEYLDQGSLSFAFNKALTNIKGSDVSYRSLFAQINTTMSTIAREQNPVAEGEGLDNIAFGRGLVNSTNYFMAIEFDRQKQLIKLSSGLIAGIYPSSKVSFYKAGTVDTSGQSPLFFGEVISSASLFSVVKINKLPDDFTPQSVWCYMKEASIPIDTVTIVIKSEILSSLPKGFIEDVKKFRLAKIVQDNVLGDLFIEQIGETGLFKVVSGRTGMTVLDSTSDAGKMKATIKNFTKARLFESLNFKNPDLRLNMELVPVKFDKQNRKVTDTLNIRDYYKNGVLTVTENDYFMIKMKNVGNEKAFFNIISIEENSKLMLLIPYLKKNENPANYYIEPEKEFIIPNFLYRFRNKTTFNYTSETIKVIATKEPLDLRYAFMRDIGDDPGSNKGEPSFLEEIMKMDDNLMNRAGITAPQNEMISTYTITIRKRK